MNFFLKTNLKLHLIKKIAKQKGFSFKAWTSTEIRKFVEVLLPIADEIKPQVFRSLFDNIFASDQGNNYIHQLCKNIGELHISFPSRHLSYFMDKIEPSQLQKTLKELLSKLSSFRAEGYKDIRKKKIPYLLLESSFYSNYYLDQI